MGLAWEQVVVDAADPVMLGRWWARVLGWVVLNDAPDDFEIRPTTDRLPGMIFEPVGQAKGGKNRLHLDFGLTTSRPKSRASWTSALGSRM